MTRALANSLLECLFGGKLDLAGSYHQINGSNDSCELQNHSAAAFGEVVNPDVAVSGALRCNVVDEEFRNPIEIRIAHVLRPVVVIAQQHQDMDVRTRTEEVSRSSLFYFCSKKANRTAAIQPSLTVAVRLSVDFLLAGLSTECRLDYCSRGLGQHNNEFLDDIRQLRNRRRNPSDDNAMRLAVGSLPAEQRASKHSVRNMDVGHAIEENFLNSKMLNRFGHLQTSEGVGI